MQRCSTKKSESSEIVIPYLLVKIRTLMKISVWEKVKRRRIFLRNWKLQEIGSKINYCLAVFNQLPGVVPSAFLK
jgi:hypothetical protein